MVKDIFILPGNKQKLFDRYLNNSERGPLKEWLELARKALDSKLSSGERSKHGPSVGTHKLSMERRELERKIFRMALKSFTERIYGE